MLLNLGRHMELVQRLRGAIWRAAAYPLMVMAGVLIVVTFLAFGVIPQFNRLFNDLRLADRLPGLTRAMMMMPQIMPWALGVLGVIAVVIAAMWISMKRSGRENELMERWLLPLPLVGPILHYNLLARWCDAMGLAISGGMDLPQAIEMADDAVVSPALTRDGSALIAALTAGHPLESVTQTKMLPATIVAAIALASKQNDLPAALATLSDMYQQQAQLRLALLPGLLTPILVIVIAIIIGTIILALFLPFLTLLRIISG
jgi:type IV pilus assembly protein PilC